YLFAGEQWDPDLGLYYNRARYMNPNTGRFWTMDENEGNPTDPLSLHKYVYAADNPVNRIDPSGEEGTAIELNISGALVAGLAAFTAASVYEAKTHAVGNVLAAAYTAATTASIAVAAEELVRPKTRAEFRRRVKEKTKNDGGSFIFLHG